MPEICLDKLKGFTFFSGLDDAVLSKIIDKSRALSYPSGHTIYMRGDELTSYFLVLSGLVGLSVGDERGKEVLLDLIGPGESFEERIFFGNAISTLDAQTLASSQLVQIPITCIEELRAEHPIITINLASILTNRLQTRSDQIALLTLKTASQRVGLFLLKHYKKMDATKLRFRLPFKKSVIAASLGMKPETFSRTLAELKENGVIIEKNMVSLSHSHSLYPYCDSEFKQDGSTGTCPNCPF